MKVKNIGVLLLAGVCGCSTAPKVDNRPVAALDLERYLGEWYEIARFDHVFERGIDKCKAVYSLRKDGKVDVVNSGVKNGKLKEAHAVAKTTETPGLLRVSFFWPFYADYRVLMVDEGYSSALVGSGGAGYLWILSRNPAMDEKAKAILLDEAKRRGYDVSALIWVRQ